MKRAGHPLIAWLAANRGTAMDITINVVAANGEKKVRRYNLSVNDWAETPTELRVTHNSYPWLINISTRRTK